ncbi:MAG: hypothetical protein K2W78_00160 [Xanthobacteraceae bacterium]|nr:hypothetical protein [Xanthobacteraceae bacterium]
MTATVCVLAVTATQVCAAAVTRESDISSIRLGQRIYVDDATCPTGQIKEITGKTLTVKGVSAVKRCVPRKDARPN